VCVCVCGHVWALNGPIWGPCLGPPGPMSGPGTNIDRDTDAGRTFSLVFGIKVGQKRIGEQCLFHRHLVPHTSRYWAHVGPMLEPILDPFRNILGPIGILVGPIWGPLIGISFFLSICIYTYTCVYIYMYIHVYIYIYTRIHTCIYVYTHVYIFIYIYIYVHKFPYMPPI
jgi:hypothetical protein